MTTCLLFSTFQTCLLERQWLLIIMAALPSDKKKKKSERGWWSNEELCLIIVVRQKEGLRDLSSFQKCCKTRFPLQFQNQLLTHNHMCIVILPVLLSIHTWFSSIVFNAGILEPKGDKGSDWPPQISADQLTLFQPGGRLCPSHYYSSLTPYF